MYVRPSVCLSQYHIVSEEDSGTPFRIVRLNLTLILNLTLTLTFATVALRNGGPTHKRNRAGITITSPTDSRRTLLYFAKSGSQIFERVTPSNCNKLECGTYEMAICDILKPQYLRNLQDRTTIANLRAFDLSRN